MSFVWSSQLFTFAFVMSELLLLQQNKNFLLSVLMVAFCCVGAASGNDWQPSI